LKPLVSIYCEGGDTKIAVISKEKEKFKVIKAASFEVLQNPLDLEEGISSLNIEGEELEFEGIEKATASPKNLGVSSQGIISAFLKDVNLTKHLFIPALTEPSIYYHIYDGSKNSKSSKLVQEIIADIYTTKNIHVDPENLSYTELSDKSLLVVFLTGEVSCVKLINSIARYNGKRYYKIPTIKSAESSLAYYVAKRKKFFPDDYSLIVYIGKEYSKLIFLHGRKLKHIGTTLDIGTINLHTYDVYFSKILLEMENGGISSLDNIVVCGEDDSENLVLSFYGTFPEANVSRLDFDDVDLSELDGEAAEIISSFSVPIAVATEYYDEQAEEHKGVNLLPKYVKEDQKFFQFTWHAYIILALLFASAFFITQEILKNEKELDQLDAEITQQTILLRQNQEILNQIAELESKISGFDQTQAILDSVAVGAEVWTTVLADISDFFSPRKNVWLTKLQKDQDDFVAVEGYSTSKFVLTDFAYSIPGAELRTISYEELREQNIYKFSLIFNLITYPKRTE
jgi:Tfp pilus assembly protein PilN